ncbi:hypothetical protein FQN60_017488 [Etheostoma spectabile]|uniref:DUF3730 domain-containing protein n=1 Tax=Etheostoma spectabile TaxID=54343 RepID=A0A5J5CBY4_9PERO|nr:hypothetical protein FQN60_017488 [Etheostoma spectabile]
MTESLKLGFDFPSPVVQAQSVRQLVAAVLKEKGPNGQITQSSSQGLALEALWQQCCSDCTPVRSAVCDAVVLLVEQGHADLHYVLNRVLNLLPSARNVQGLIKVIGRLLQMQADQRDGGTAFTCPYSISYFTIVRSLSSTNIGTSRREAVFCSFPLSFSFGSCLHRCLCCLRLSASLNLPGGKMNVSGAAGWRRWPGSLAPHWSLGLALLGNCKCCRINGGCTLVPIVERLLAAAPCNLPLSL